MIPWLVSMLLRLVTKSKDPLGKWTFTLVLILFVSPGFMEICSTLWRSYIEESSVDLVGISALSWMRRTVVFLKSLGRLVYYGCEFWSLNGRSASRVIYLLVFSRRVNV